MNLDSVPNLSWPLALTRRSGFRGGCRKVWCGLSKAVKMAGRYNLHGAIAQLGERIVRNDEVVGSIPTSSTNPFNNLPPFVSTVKPSLIGPFWTGHVASLENSNPRLPLVFVFRRQRIMW